MKPRENYYLSSEVYKGDVELLMYRFHPVADMNPLMGAEEFRALKMSLSLHGQLEPILLYRGKVVDGRNRVTALYETKQPHVDYIKLKNNLQLNDLEKLVLIKETRRKQTATQLAITALGSMKSFKQEEYRRASLAYGISSKQIQRAKKVSKLLPKEQFLALHKGSLYVKLDGSKTSSLQVIIEDMKAREIIVLEEMQKSSEKDGESIRDDSDFKEGLLIAKSILKGKSENYKKGMLEGLLFETN
ncbi:hypothetical protein MNB_SV-14-340 [hydrothermal vent metagenome]|uniref:ParB/Sulfiredoxin domain-containing protein n=1 Tax=hydrothermal vent metagenome TaxID=652676 RepID=A0A1W1BH11_9ZZZZ